MDMDGRRLKQWREQRSVSQSELARRLDVPVNTIWRWELDEEMPRHRVGIRHGRILALALWALDRGAGEERGNDG
jgi:transcriptional regulator with XRE-family HTH domain